MTIFQAGPVRHEGGTHRPSQQPPPAPQPTIRHYRRLRPERETQTPGRAWGGSGWGGGGRGGRRAARPPHPPPAAAAAAAASSPRRPAGTQPPGAEGRRREGRAALAWRAGLRSPQTLVLLWETEGMCAPTTRKIINYTINNQKRVRDGRAQALEGSPGRGGAHTGAGRARTGREAQAPGPAAAMSLSPESPQRRRWWRRLRAQTILWLCLRVVPGPHRPNVCPPAASPAGRRSLPHFVGPAGGVFPPLIRIHGFSLRFNGGHRDQLALSAHPLAALRSRGPGLRGEGEREVSEGGPGSFRPRR